MRESEVSLYCDTCVIVVCSWPSPIVLRARLRLLPPHLLDAGPSVPPSLRAPAKERCRLHQRTSPLHSTTAHQRFRSRGRLSMRWRCPAVCRDTLPSSGGCVACVACESVCIVHSCVNRSCELEQHSLAASCCLCPPLHITGPLQELQRAGEHPPFQRNCEQ